jgi:CYTH domain-containing protein
VEKSRFNIQASDGLTWEIDVYFGNLLGLFTAEVELPEKNFDAVMPAEIVAVLVADVTEDARYKNKNLAVNGKP